MQAENELQRARNQELVKLQEESSIRQEQARRATEEQIQAQRRQTEREKAEIERETIRVRAIAEAEGRAHEAKLSEEVNRRMLVDRANAEREKWIAAINTTFDHIGGMYYSSPIFTILSVIPWYIFHSFYGKELIWNGVLAQFCILCLYWCLI